MADAGKVAILPRGLWNAETVYEPLDLVYYNNNSFVALKASVGVTPVDGDTWMLSLSGISQETINAILNGTQQVGDSAKLGGKDASEYALDTDLLNYLLFNGSKQVYNPVSDLNNFYTGIGLFNGVANEPYPAWWLVVSAGLSGTVSQVAFNLSRELTPKTRYCAGGTWLDWTDLNKDYLPLSGGTVGNGTADIPLWLYGKNNTLMEFVNKDGFLGRVGFSQQKGFNLYDENWVGYPLFGTHNKPSGTYTGNHETRTIDTGAGSFGQACIILDHNTGSGWALITRYGGTGHMDGNAAEQNSLQCKISDGVITVSSESYLNISGHLYEYRVI